jgi:23S rRNA (guanosine2251-2'-O)-methyltransferase
MTRQHSPNTRTPPDEPILTGAKPVLELLSLEPARVVNLARALDEAERAAFTIYGAAVREEGQSPVFGQELVFPALLVLGGEERGLRRQIAGRCHHFLHIPMLREFDSLGVAQAGAILISCFARQKMQGI